MTRLLVTDLDGTFVGDDVATHELWGALDDAGIAVAFATGRHLDSIRDLYRRWATMRRAEACITMVGTEIWRLVGGRYEQDLAWARRLDESWDRGAVDALVVEILGPQRQPREWQSPRKSSWFVDGDAAGVERLRRGLHDAGLSVKVVYSADRFLDVLPAGAGKGPAVVHLAGNLGIEPGGVVTAGDSGNDLDMMDPALGFAAIVVGNATAELSAFHGRGVHHVRAHFAAGIAEGLRELGWL